MQPAAFVWWKGGEPATAPRGGIHLPARPKLFLYGDRYRASDNTNSKAEFIIRTYPPAMFGMANVPSMPTGTFLVLAS
jgi:hypothetical protein